ncbi:BMA_0021/BMA_0022 family TOMM bacteriocin [Pedobacter caeni]|uniref:Ribosomal natural product, two-chain TOMM family n=1 Tax=Pedobacter caeni TaxID=288992 RepID=A0A1M5F3H7_9SPHI|nr:BMA_0021/BMA_0022 family TOMM bacteriocin [Pedobacter caeni]SHF86093.1 ribosomal natural product, two-chain TOMM family [Pedobacter caeni]
MNLTSELMAFRTAYLQCIARGWKDEDFLKEIISIPNLKWINVLDNVVFKSFLPKEQKLNWRANVFIIENVEKDKDLLPMPVSVYAPYDPNSNNGWLGGSDLFVIKIPTAPEDVAERAEALSVYYSLFTSLFGNGYEVTDTAGAIPCAHGGVEEIMATNYKTFSLNKADFNAAIENNIQNDLGSGSNESFFGFGAIVMSIISFCWMNPGYLEYITEKNRTITPVGTEGSILRDEFISFKNPWAFNIRFEKAEEGNSTWNTESGTWEKVEVNDIFLQFPAKPNPENHSNARALSRYNNTGPAYPLTCP